ncbi:MAG: type II toxin-antitoxin system RelB/DinJ family antitoxin [Lachnospiraceae bacterium]|nr:type II toxin-antitoxin system RelB/DinJ family antitoxin [Lachnospiraceae bacterium]
MATLQIRVEDSLKSKADNLFASLGLDTSTAVRIFLNAAVEHDGIPFSIEHKAIPPSLAQAVSDSRNRRNLHGPFDSGEAAVAAMLED